MADSATTRNRLRKMESGQHSNTWATEGNADTWGDRIDEALDGYCAFTLSGSKTLTSTNYVANEARMRVLNVTSGTGGTVTIPAVEKTYLVINATSGTVIISNGSNTASVLSGNCQWVTTNGTTVNLGQVLDYGSALLLTTGTPTLGAHLMNKTAVDAAILAAQLSGTVTLGANVAAALAIAVGTTGAIVVQNGVLGTPSSGTLTNATGLPISTGLTGAGTGVLTALGVNIGSAGALVTQNGALGTPSSGTLTNCTLPVGQITGAGTGILTALAANVGSAGAPVLFNGAGGTPSSLVLTNATGSPALTAPTANTAAPGTNTTQLATTAFVAAAVSTAYTLIETIATTSGASVTSAAIPATYNDLLVVWRGVSHNDGSDQVFRIELSPDNVTYTTAVQLMPSAVAASVTVYGGILIPGYRKAAGLVSPALGSLASDNTSAIVATGQPIAWRMANPIARLRFSPAAGAFDAGAIDIYGI